MIENRKEDHIRIAEGKEVNASHNYWDDITLIHRSIPEVDYDSIDTSVNFHGNVIDYPILISSMTGGTDLESKLAEANKKEVEIIKKSRDIELKEKELPLKIEQGIHMYRYNFSLT